MPTAMAHDGTEIAWTSYGDGFPVVMSPIRRHGRTADGYAREIADGHRLILMDYPGPAKPDTLTPANAVADVLAVLDAAGIDRFGWVGYSFGSVLGLQVACAVPDRIAAFVCGGWTPMGAPYAGMVDLSETLARLVRRVLGKRRASSARQWVTFYRGLRDWDEAAAREALATTPRLVLVGDRDRSSHAPLADLVAAHEQALIADGWDVRYLEGRHHSVLVRPSVVGPAVRDWLDANLPS